jgi:peroxiredoxin
MSPTDQSNLARLALKPGDPAPDFTLPDTNGTLVSCGALLRRGPVVITFYRGVWCPLCRGDLQALEDVADEATSLGASLLAIARETAPGQHGTLRPAELSFPLLNDQSGDVAVAFGIRFVETGPAADLTLTRSESPWIRPMQARFVVGPDGIIAHSEVFVNFPDEPMVTNLIPILERLSPAS